MNATILPFAQPAARGKQPSQDYRPGIGVIPMDAARAILRPRPCTYDDALRLQRVLDPMRALLASTKPGQPFMSVPGEDPRWAKVRRILSDASVV
jgi:hypothetical protein